MLWSSRQIELPGLEGQTPHTYAGTRGNKAQCAPAAPPPDNSLTDTRKNWKADAALVSHSLFHPHPMSTCHVWTLKMTHERARSLHRPEKVQYRPCLPDLSDQPPRSTWLQLCEQTVALSHMCGAEAVSRQEWLTNLETRLKHQESHLTGGH